MSLVSWVTLGNIVQPTSISSSDVTVYMDLHFEGEYQNELSYEGEFRVIQ